MRNCKELHWFHDFTYEDCMFWEKIVMLVKKVRKDFLIAGSKEYLQPLKSKLQRRFVDGRIWKEKNLDFGGVRLKKGTAKSKCLLTTTGEALEQSTWQPQEKGWSQSAPTGTKHYIIEALPALSYTRETAFFIKLPLWFFSYNKKFSI